MHSEWRRYSVNFQSLGKTWESCGGNHGGEGLQLWGELQHRKQKTAGGVGLVEHSKQPAELNPGRWLLSTLEWLKNVFVCKDVSVSELIYFCWFRVRLYLCKTVALGMSGIKAMLSNLFARPIHPSSLNSWWIEWGWSRDTCTTHSHRRGTHKCKNKYTEREKGHLVLHVVAPPSFFY